MKATLISDGWFRCWKIWGPVFNTIFLAGVGTWYWNDFSGLFPIVDVIFSFLIAIIIIQIWWIAINLKNVAMDETSILVSDLRSTELIPRSHIKTIIDRTNWKRIPSTIILDPPSMHGKKIRFFPAKPTDKVFKELERNLG